MHPVNTEENGRILISLEFATDFDVGRLQSDIIDEIICYCALLFSQQFLPII